MVLVYVLLCEIIVYIVSCKGVSWNSVIVGIRSLDDLEEQTQILKENKSVAFSLLFYLISYSWKETSVNGKLG